MFMGVFDRGHKHRHNHLYCGCSRRRIIIEGTLFTSLKIIVSPILFAYEGPRHLKRWYERRNDYDRTSPKKRERIDKQIFERAIAKKVPRVLGSRLGDEVFLTCGKDDISTDVKNPLGRNAGGKGDGDGRRGKELWKMDWKGKGKAEEIKCPNGLISTQEDSSLFHLLPAEVRRLIWTEVIGGYLFYIRYIPAYKRISFTRCRHSFGDAACAEERCSEFMKQKDARDNWGNVELLSLLLTCRRIYSEAIDVLYSENLFCFSSLHDVQYFSLLVLPQRMRKIRNVRWRENTNSPYLATTPWLDCKAKSSKSLCDCIECWPKAIASAEANEQYRIEAFAEVRWLLKNGQYSIREPYDWAPN